MLFSSLAHYTELKGGRHSVLASCSLSEMIRYLDSILETRKERLNYEAFATDKQSIKVLSQANKQGDVLTWLVRAHVRDYLLNLLEILC